MNFEQSGEFTYWRLNLGYTALFIVRSNAYPVIGTGDNPQAATIDIQKNIDLYKTHIRQIATEVAQSLVNEIINAYKSDNP